MRMVEPAGASRYFHNKKSRESSRLKRFSNELEDQNSRRMLSQAGQYSDDYDVDFQFRSYNFKIPHKKNLYFSDIRILNEDAQPSNINKVCPVCQLIYKKNSMKGQEITPYIDEDKKVKISI